MKTLTMRCATAVILCTIAAVAPLHTQPSAVPDSIDINLARFVGSWEGTRTIIDQNGSKMESPVSFIAYRTLANTAIEIKKNAGEEGAAQLESVALLVWDSELQKMVEFSASSQPGTYYAEGSWTNDEIPTLRMSTKKAVGDVVVEFEEVSTFPDGNHLIRSGTVTIHRMSGTMFMKLESRFERRK